MTAAYNYPECRVRLKRHSITLPCIPYSGPPIVEAPESDDVRTPTHYQVFPGTESIEIIARSMTQAEFRGFCMGNVLKYRLRAGKKSDQASIGKDLSKADFYKELFEEHRYKCHSLK